MTTEFLDKQFIKEFKTVCSQLRTQNTFNIQQVPNPIHLKETDLVRKLKVKGLEDPYLQALNGTHVDWLNVRTVERNIYWNKGHVKKQETYSVPKGAQLIRTPLNLEVPAKHQYADEGINYVDYKDEEDTRYFYYTLPDTNLYEVQETALVIAERYKPSHYGGVRLVTTTGFTFFLYTVPIKRYKKIDSQRIIATDVGINYTDVVQTLMQHWITQRYIFDSTDLNVTVPIDRIGATNLAYHYLEPTLEYDDTSDYTLADNETRRLML